MSHLPLKTLIAMALTIFLTMAVSWVIEGYAMSQEIVALDTFVELAAEDAIRETQNLYLDADGGGGNIKGKRGVFQYAWYDETLRNRLIALQGSSSIDRFISDYVVPVRTGLQAKGLTPYDPTRNQAPKENETDLFWLLDYMTTQGKRAQAKMGTGTDGGNYTWNPLQFGMTYLDKEVLAEIFAYNLEQLIKMNYGPSVQKNWWGWNRMDMMDRTYIKNHLRISGPNIGTLVPAKAAGSEGPKAAQIAYEQMFGSTWSATSSLMFNQLHGKDWLGRDWANARYDGGVQVYVYYDIDFVGSVWHNTRTWAFGIKTDGMLVGLDISDPNYISMGPPLNDLGNPTKPFLRIRLPESTYSMRYIYTY